MRVAKPVGVLRRVFVLIGVLACPTAAWAQGSLVRVIRIVGSTESTLELAQTSRAVTMARLASCGVTCELGELSKALASADEVANADLALASLGDETAIARIEQAAADAANGSALAPGTRVHHLESLGRLRIWIPGLRANPAIANDLQAVLAQIPQVQEATISTTTGTALIFYEPGTNGGAVTLSALARAGYVDESALVNVALPRTDIVSKLLDGAGSMATGLAFGLVPGSSTVKLVSSGLEANSEWYVVHATAGRLRVRIPKMKSAKQVERIVKDLMQDADGVTRVSTSNATGSAVIYFDPAATTTDDLLARLQAAGYYDPALAITADEYVQKVLKSTGKKYGSKAVEDSIETAVKAAVLSLL